RAAEPALLLQVEALTLDDLDRRFDQHPRSLGALQRRPKGEREEPVSGIDALRLPPDRPDGGTAPPEQVAVLDVVVHQGEVVEELDRGRHAQRALRLAAAGGGRPEAEARAHALATAAPRPPPILADPAHLVGCHAADGRP